MQLGGEQRLDAPQEVVWAALQDPDILRRCIPGCESVEQVSAAEIRALATASAGSAQARFTSRLTVTAVDPPTTLRIAGRSQGGSAGSATGSADLRIEAADATSTVVKYEVQATLAGPIGLLDQEAADQSLRKMTDDFLRCLNGALSNPVKRRRRTAVPEPGASRNPGAPFWLAVILVLVTLVLYSMALL